MDILLVEEDDTNLIEVTNYDPVNNLFNGKFNLKLAVELEKKTPTIQIQFYLHL